MAAQTTVRETHITAETDNAHTSTGIFLSGDQRVIYSGTIPTASIKMQIAEGGQDLSDVASTEWVDVPDTTKTSTATLLVLSLSHWARFVISGGGSDTVTVTTTRVNG